MLRGKFQKSNAACTGVLNTPWQVQYASRGIQHLPLWLHIWGVSAISGCRGNLLLFKLIYPALPSCLSNLRKFESKHL